MKAIAGSILAGLGLVAMVLNEWLPRIVGALDSPLSALYSGPLIYIWVSLGLGIILLIWGLWDIEIKQRKGLRANSERK